MDSNVAVRPEGGEDTWLYSHEVIGRHGWSWIHLLQRPLAGRDYAQTRTT